MKKGKLIVLSAPSGTGKTTTLLNLVDKYLKKTDPDKIGYFAFTQKAAYEARDRAMEKFNLTEDDLPYFRTLHSLAFRRLGIKKENVMQRKHYVDLGNKINMRIDYNEYDEDLCRFYGIMIGDGHITKKKTCNSYECGVTLGFSRKNVDFLENRGFSLKIVDFHENPGL